MEKFRGTRLEVNLDTLKNNLKAINAYKEKDTKTCIVVKGNGYGCGSYMIAKTALEYGATYLAVAVLNEAIYLREKGINAPILILGHTFPQQLNRVVEFDLTQTIFDLDTAKELNRLANIANKKVKIHIKIDTGMHRLGIQVNKDTIKCIKAIIEYENLEVEGIFTHLSKVYDGDREYTTCQINKFLDVLNRLEKEKINIPIRHMLSSGGLLEYNEYQLDMVRIGCLTYGLYPPCSVKGKLQNEKVFSLKTKIAHIKKVEKGSQLSYSGKYTTIKDTTIATLPVGYNDGYPRRLSCKGEVIVGNKLSPIRGNICMDMCMIDLDEIPDARVGDDVILFGRQGDLEVNIEGINDIVESIRTEIITTISTRVPRVYIENDDVVYIEENISI